MEDIFSSLATYGYIGLFIYSLGGGFIALVGASVLAFMGKMDLSLVMLIAFSANVLGDFMLFFMARYQKKMMVENLKVHRRKLALAYIMIRNNGSWIIIFQKFIYGVKTLIPIAIGLTKYDARKFGILNIIGAVLWVITFGLGSYYFGEVLVKFAGVVISKPWLAPVIIFILGGLLWIYLERATKKKA